MDRHKEHHQGHQKHVDDNADVLDHSRSCPMIMVFHGGHCERILWDGWTATTFTDFVLSACVIFLLAFLYEFLKYLREQILRREVRKETARLDIEIKLNVDDCCEDVRDARTPKWWDRPYVRRMFGVTHLLQTLINIVQILISYLLMLIFMTFNYWLCLAIVLGLGCGYFFFGWNKQDVEQKEWHEMKYVFKDKTETHE